MLSELRRALPGFASHCKTPLHCYCYAFAQLRGPLCVVTKEGDNLQSTLYKSSEAERPVNHVLAEITDANMEFSQLTHITGIDVDAPESLTDTDPDCPSWRILQSNPPRLSDQTPPKIREVRDHYFNSHERLDHVEDIEGQGLRVCLSCTQMFSTRSKNFFTQHRCSIHLKAQAQLEEKNDRPHSSCQPTRQLRNLTSPGAKLMAPPSLEGSATLTRR